MSAAPAIVLEHLSFARGEQMVLDDLNAVLAADDFVVLVGPNGAGKSTLLHLILGLLTPTGGGVTLLGGAPAATRAAVGYVPQHGRFDRRFPIDVGGMVLQGRQPPGWHPGWRPTAADQAAVDEALTRCGIAKLSRRRLGALSGGEMQRALIARALAGKPRLLLLDEPMAGTDPEESKKMGDLINSLREEHTLILVEHDMDAVFRLADRVSVLVAGHVIASGQPDEIRNDPQVIAAYLGEDETATENMQ